MLRLVLLVPLLAIGVISFAFVRAHSGDGDALVARQRQARALSAAGVTRVVKAAPDPGTGRGRAVAGRCVPLGGDPLRNPWRCTLRYPSGRHIRWTVTIAPDGSYVGSDQVVTFEGETRRFPGSIDGCCVAVP